MEWLPKYNKLDPAQLQVIQQILGHPGNHFVEGFPGTGKSVVLAHAAMRCQEQAHQEAIILTYTNALVECIREGVRPLPVMTIDRFVDNLDRSKPTVGIFFYQRQWVCGNTHHVDALIREVLGFAPKTAERGGSRVLYLKQSERISDFLTYLGAPVAAMGIMEARLEKELNNRVNRCCNCDDANTSKVVDAAQEQLAAIRLLRSSGRLEKLPPKLLQAAKAREENPEAALLELAALMEPPITKPAMSHRLRRLIELAKETQK